MPRTVRLGTVSQACCEDIPRRSFMGGTVPPQQPEVLMNELEEEEPMRIVSFHLIGAVGEGSTSQQESSLLRRARKRKQRQRGFTIYNGSGSPVVHL